MLTFKRKREKTENTTQTKTDELLPMRKRFRLMIEDCQSDDSEEEEEGEKEVVNNQPDDEFQALTTSFNTLNLSKAQELELASPLHAAAAEGDLNQVQKILAKHFNIIKSYIGWTVGYAAENGHKDVVIYLLNHYQANIEQGNIRWAICQANDNHHSEIVDLLTGYLNQHRSRWL